MAANGWLDLHFSPSYMLGNDNKRRQRCREPTGFDRCPHGQGREVRGTIAHA